MDANLTISEDRFKLLNRVFAVVVLLTTFVVYFLTKAPTLSFWDCGEFIATSYILGIPHPPGTPLYVIIGRIFSMIPFVSDIPARLNTMSGLFSAIAAMFGYLTSVRLLRIWFPKLDSWYHLVLIFAGGVSGAFLLAFGRTQWNNSVEAEVYGMSMALFLACLWLTLKYLDVAGTTRGARYMLVVVYLGFLGIGVHMQTFMVLPIAFLAFALKKGAPKSHWYAIGAFIVLALYALFAMSSKPDEIAFYMPVVLVLVMYVFYALSLESFPSNQWPIAGGLALGCLPGLAALGGVENTIINVIGALALVALFTLSLIRLIQYFRLTAEERGTEIHSAVTAGFGIAAGLMALLLVSGIKGMNPFLLLVALMTAVLGWFIRKSIQWHVVIALGGSLAVILGIYQFAYGVVFALVLTVALGLAGKLPHWRVGVGIILVAVMGFSVHLFLPIRSSLQPAINENNPSRSLEQTVQFLERKQYHSDSMVERMFNRRAEWENQFGNHNRMGFWGFFREQYGLKDVIVGGKRIGPEGFLFIPLFVLGLFGLWEVARRRASSGMLFVALLLLCTVGLIMYMNFADGTRIDPVTGRDYLEVRDRDYFFTPGFMLFGLAIGLGIAGFIQYIREVIGGFGPGPKKVVLAALTVLFLVPGYALGVNYYYADRSQNYVPYDYAWSLLQSCDENAVLFTNADNDTFPVWCLQQVYGVRTDVKVINLALANGRWYVRQARDILGLELGWTDEQIDNLRPFRTTDGRSFRIQDQLIDQVVRHQYGKMPINYCTTCSASARTLNGQNADSLLEMVGLMYRLTSYTGEGLRTNIEDSKAILMSPEKTRFTTELDPSKIYLTETTRRLTSRVAQIYAILADDMMRAGDVKGAIEVCEYIAGKVPYYNGVERVLTELYLQDGQVEKLDSMIVASGLDDDPRYMVNLAHAYRTQNKPDKAAPILADILYKNPSFRPALDEYMRLLIRQENFSEVLVVLNTWMANNPQDQEIQIVRDQFLKELKEQGLAGDSGS